MAQASFISLYNTNMTIGQKYRFEIYSYDSSHLHKLVIKCGSKSMTFDKVKGGVETYFTIPLDWANAIPNATSLNGSLTLTTYQSNYSTKVGSNDIETTKFTIPSTMIPSVSLSVSEAMANIATKFNAYIQSKSKLAVAITAAGAYGSTIKSYKTTIDGVAYSTASFTSQTINKSGQVAIKTTVTDSRGKTATTSNIITVVPYTQPTIYSFVCSRANSSGVVEDDGQYAKIDYKFAISKCNNLNDKSYTIQFRETGNSFWTTLKQVASYEEDTTLFSSGFILNTEKTYDYKLTIKDYFVTKTAEFTIGTAFTLIDFKENGKALAFGKVAERETGVEFGMKAWFQNGESPNGAVDIPNSTDLDDLMDEGFYCIPTSSVSGSILNKPYTGTATGIMFVFRAGNEGQRCQVFARCTKEVSEIYMRWYYQDSWGSWVQI